ncbi:hypothetical protein JX265_002617 [Neoarthrinium moseri]|uniref:Uncharacterized protein n=1 Tax=Neoarthrinium moseri TaxID=1658444 RepID=A0A9P9WUR9_9PEZI|nr:uncharacterized protein JN550_000430 [Neoarthrinium moseri]KAI1842846.1 hypothetical protein JX266_011022 [Neoarthrinium moseri]KAI1878248.1 hypothetical protein JN550_000430 [Neoarthrinium moseri]KAI1879663.1 hypothetical protein JX265_002617 [Neoarthrinium moseri]
MSAFVNWESLLSPASPKEKVKAPAPPPRGNTAVPVPPELPSASVPWATAATIGAVILSTLLILYLVRSNARAKSTATRLAATKQRQDEAIIAAVQKTLGEQIKATEEKFQQTLDRRIKDIQETSQQTLDGRISAIEETSQQMLDSRIAAIEEAFQQTLDHRIAEIEDAIRRRVNQRLEALESKIKMDQEAIDSLHNAINQRMEILEDGVRILDGKQLDQEATHITSRSLGQRLETVEGSLQALDAKTRASSQRIEAVDDSARVIDSRTKALSQRMEAVEDNLSATDGQVTLLSHDASRGVDAIERLQKQVKNLPGNEKLRELTGALEERFKELESRINQYQLAIEEARAEPEPEPEPRLTWSHIESQEIEPTGPIYVRPSYGHSPTLSYDGSLPPTPSSSGRSYSFTSSNAGYPITTPTNSKRRRMEMAAGFQDTTFASRQKLFNSRQEMHQRKDSIL